MAYTPDPDHRDPPPADVVAGLVAAVIATAVFIGGPAILIAALWLAFGPQPLPPA